MLQIIKNLIDQKLLLHKSQQAYLRIGSTNLFIKEPLAKPTKLISKNPT
jgi:hypothetical protein